MNGTMLQAFEWYLPEDAQHWARLRALAPALAGLGFTAVWLPPAFKCAGGIHDVGYGVYDTYDLGEFDQKGSIPTKYGLKSAYLELTAALHAAGLSVLPDIVLNHRMGADGWEQIRAQEVSPQNRWQPVSPEETVRVWTKFTFPGRHGVYSDFTWDANCFDGSDWDDLSRRQEILRFSGKSWDPEVDTENGNYDYLMGADLDMRVPAVRDELRRWGLWYLEQTKADGFRLDAVKHIDRDFYRDWLTYLRQTSGKELFAVGEYWSPDLSRLTAYLDGDRGCMSLFDVPLHFKLRAASCSGGSQDLRRLFDGTLVGTRPTLAVTFVDNHDTQPGQALASYVERWFRPAAYALILLREAGYPCVFYGDLFGIPHDGILPLPELPVLLAARKNCAYGPQHDYFDHPDVVGWTREGDDAHPGSGLAVLLSDGPGGQKTMYTGRSGETWYPVLGSGRPVLTGPDGCGTFSAPGGGMRLYLRESAIPR